VADTVATELYAVWVALDPWSGPPLSLPRRSVTEGVSFAPRRDESGWPMVGW
jgi:hypothetical protein